MPSYTQRDKVIIGALLGAFILALALEYWAVWPQLVNAVS